MRFGCLVAALLFSTSAEAVAVYGIGAQSCGEFVRVIDDMHSNSSDFNDHYAFISWAQGYLSQYNNLKGNNILRSSDPTGIQLWLYNYCRVHPLENFDSALDAMINELSSPSRQ
jgi:hypothetical protein